MTTGAGGSSGNIADERGSAPAAARPRAVAAARKCRGSGAPLAAPPLAASSAAAAPRRGRGGTPTLATDSSGSGSPIFNSAAAFDLGGDHTHVEHNTPSPQRSATEGTYY